MATLGVGEPRVAPPAVEARGKEWSPASPSPPTEGPSAFARLLGALGREVSQGEGVMQGALDATHSGKDLGPAELIALQAGVYRYGEAVDLASRLIDRATSGVKTVLQGQ